MRSAGHSCRRPGRDGRTREIDGGMSDIVLLCFSDVMPKMSAQLNRDYVPWTGSPVHSGMEGDEKRLHLNNFTLSRMRRTLGLPEKESKYDYGYVDRREERLTPARTEMIGAFYKLTQEESAQLRQAFILMAHPLSRKTRRDALVRMQTLCASFLHAVETAVQTIRDEIDKRAIGLRKHEQAEIRRQVWFFNFFRGKMLQRMARSIENARWSVTNLQLEHTLENLKGLVKMGAKQELPNFGSSKPWKARTRRKYIPAGAPTSDFSEGVLLDVLDETLENFIEETPQSAMASKAAEDAAAKLIDDMAGLDALTSQLAGAATVADAQLKEQLANKSSFGVSETAGNFDKSYSDRFENDRFHKGGDLAVLNWNKCCVLAESNDIYHLLKDEAYKFQTLFELERASVQALIGVSVSLKCLTDSTAFNRFFASTSSSYTQQPPSVYKFFADLVLASLAGGLKQKPLLKKALLEWLPNPAGADLAELRAAIEQPNWLQNRAYSWRGLKANALHTPWVPPTSTSEGLSPRRDASR